MDTTESRPVLSAPEAAKALGVSDETIRRYLREHTLEGFTLPSGHCRIYADSVAKLMSV